MSVVRIDLVLNQVDQGIHLRFLKYIGRQCASAKKINGALIIFN